MAARFILLSEEQPMADKPGLGRRWAEYRPSKPTWFWSCVACVVATLIIGFAWGGWVTGGSAAQMAAKSADEARDTIMAAVCVSQFENSPDRVAQLALLKKADSWGRNDFITKGGWVTPPGMKDPVTGAAGLCVQKLMSADLPPAKTSAAPG
jgi:hypothetical protein